MKKNLIVRDARSAHCARTLADETAVAAQPSTPEQSARIAGSFNRGDGDDLAVAAEQPFKSSHVDAVLDHLRQTRMQKSRPH